MTAHNENEKQEMSGCPFCGVKATQEGVAGKAVCQHPFNKCTLRGRLFFIQDWESRAPAPDAALREALEKRSRMLEKISSEAEAWAEDEKQDSGDAFALICKWREQMIDLGLPAPTPEA